MSGNYWLNEIKEKEATERWLPPQSDENIWSAKWLSFETTCDVVFETNNDIFLKTDFLDKNGEELFTIPNVVYNPNLSFLKNEPISCNSEGTSDLQCNFSNIVDNMNFTIENVETRAGRAVGSGHEFAPVEIEWGIPPLCNVTITCHEPIVNLSVDNLPTLKFRDKFQDSCC